MLLTRECTAVENLLMVVRDDMRPTCVAWGANSRDIVLGD